MAFAGAMTANQLARGASEKTVFGWQLEIIGERARYFACTAENACTFRPVEVPAKSLVAKRVVNRTHPAREDGTSGEEVDVLQLTLAGEVQTTRGGISSDARGLVVQ